MAIAQLLAIVSPKLEYHEDRGCMFDYNEDRRSIVKGIRNPMIEPEPCLKLIPASLREAALALTDALRQEHVAGKDAGGHQSSAQGQRAAATAKPARRAQAATA